MIVLTSSARLDKWSWSSVSSWVKNSGLSSQERRLQVGLPESCLRKIQNHHIDRYCIHTTCHSIQQVAMIEGLHQAPTPPSSQHLDAVKILSAPVVCLPSAAIIDEKASDGVDLPLHSPLRTHCLRLLELLPTLAPHTHLQGFQLVFVGRLPR